VRYAFDAIRRRPGRSLLTSLGIGLAVGLVVMLLALSNGIESSASSLAAASGIDLIGTSPTNGTPLLSGEFPPFSGAHALSTEIPRYDTNVVTASPWLISDLVFGNASLRAAANNSSVPSGWAPTGSGTVGWIPDDNAGIETPELSNGTGFSAPGDPHYANGTYAGPSTHEIVIDQNLAGVLHVTVGDALWASPVSPPNSSSLTAWYANATYFQVVGVSGPFWLVPTATLAFVYLSELQSMVGGASNATDYASLMLIHLSDPTRATTDQVEISAKFPGLTLVTVSSVLNAIEHVVNLYRTFGTLIAAIGIVVAALFTTTVLQMSVDDRSRELALLRAIGYSRARVGGAVVEESVLLAAIGLAIGLPVAYLGASAINAFLVRLIGGLPKSFSFVGFDLGVILAGVLLVVAVGLAAAIAPAARAMQLPVAEELRAP
jgi:putative ABC transport system permease protein